MEYKVVGSLMPRCGVLAAHFSAGVSQIPHNQHHLLRASEEIKPLFELT
jgi:hypothetical protein